MNLISTTELSLANAIAHDALSPYLVKTIIGCERCGNPHLLIVDCKHARPRNEMEDIILETSWFFKCPECGFEEADHLITIIPSWQWHRYREKMPKTGKELFKEKINIARHWGLD
jgi:hypothetical protein